jgi:hypothetical protein
VLTDAPLRKAGRVGFLESDRITRLHLPQNGCLLAIAKFIESAMGMGNNAKIVAALSAGEQPRAETWQCRTALGLYSGERAERLQIGEHRENPIRISHRNSFYDLQIDRVWGNPSLLKYRADLCCQIRGGQTAWR